MNLRVNDGMDNRPVAKIPTLMSGIVEDVVNLGKKELTLSGLRAQEALASAGTRILVGTVALAAGLLCLTVAAVYFVQHQFALSSGASSAIVGGILAVVGIGVLFKKGS